MKKNTKVAILIVVAMVFIGLIYFVSKKQPDNSIQIAKTNDEININSDSEVVVPKNDTIVAPPTIKATTKLDTSTGSQSTSPSLELLKYKGEFFPFEFKYPASFRLAKNIVQSTNEHESKSYNFNRLATDGGVAGYVSFYVEIDNDSKYVDLVKTYPNKYSIVEINGYKFYKLVEINSISNKEVRIEYVTFKDGVKYRFALVAVNGERKALNIEAYQNELAIMDIIAKSITIN